ncbi:uncharacterized protein LOC130051959 isoform X2 [Ostrea edulis]|uniref:uncharacterized protein LOC130051959 isoform X2 n=1 Tax=Ostrea edulis TaxID=37623 RepID=UPI0024AED65A|nr:uncharacterized protein LOC130051959 isoform X2 [Ostrea edulis]
MSMMEAFYPWCMGYRCFPLQERNIPAGRQIVSCSLFFQEYVTWMEVGKSLYSYCGQRWSEESMSLCLSLSININILLEHTAAPALTRGVIKHGTTSINFPKDVHNQILQLLHYSEYLDHRQMRK